jgi:hypothetical protein
VKWITQTRPKVDRVACPWLIKRFVDPQAEFLYVPTDQVMEVAKREGAIPSMWKMLNSATTVWNVPRRHN